MTELPLLNSTLCMRVECLVGDKIEEHDLVLQHTYPVQRIVSTGMVPHCPDPVVTVGGIEYHQARTVQVPKLEVALAAYGEHPPLKRRRGPDRYKNVKPIPGELVGFISCLPLTYMGACTPSETNREVVVQLFHLDRPGGEKLYISGKEAIRVLFEGGCGGTPLTTLSLSYCKRSFSNDPESIVLKHSMTAPFDTLLLMKLLGVVEKMSNSACFVPTELVDNFLIGERGAGHKVEWVCPTHNDEDYESDGSAQIS